MRRRGKFNNHVTHVDGIRFQSKAEARRYCQLKDMETRGEIEDLELQRRYPLWACGPSGENVLKCCDYVCDFQYRREGTLVIEDVKGAAPTPLFKLKRRLMAICHGIDVQIVYMGREKE